MKDKPEWDFHKAIGVLANFAKGLFEGRPCLLADLHYRREHQAEAMTYPWLSVERRAWSDPDVHAITAPALLRRKPERDLPMVPYHAEASGQLACYGADLPSPIRESPERRRERLAWLGVRGLTGEAGRLAWARHVAEKA